MIKRSICAILLLSLFLFMLYGCSAPASPSESLPQDVPDASRTDSAPESTDNSGRTDVSEKTESSDNAENSGNDENSESSPASPSGDLQKVADAKIGDEVVFGSWDQDGKSGSEPITWIVLCQGVGKTLVLSERVLEYQCFKNETADDNYPAALYRDSDLRAFLNDSFYNGAFSDEEKSAILTSRIVSKYKDEHYTELTYETEDNVFPLSVAEAARYVCGVGTNVFGIPSDRVREENPYGTSPISGIAGVSDAMTWWLRDMGPENAKTAAVVYAGEAQRKNHNEQVYKKAGVRPAMWIVYDRSEMEGYEKGDVKPKEDNELKSKIGSLGTGVKFAFGKYDMNPYNMDGYEDLNWTVLEEYDDSFLIISEGQVGAQTFKEKPADGSSIAETCWAESDLRNRINQSGFIDFMFSPQEKDLLMLNHVVTSGEDDRTGGPATDDVLFIPDVLDIEKYFGANASIGSKYWLRSQQSWAPRIGVVYTDGSVGSDVPNKEYGVRLMARIRKPE